MGYLDRKSPYVKPFVTIYYLLFTDVLILLLTNINGVMNIISVWKLTIKISMKKLVTSRRETLPITHDVKDKHWDTFSNKQTR